MSTGTEVAVRHPQASAIPAKLAYARELANSGLLPAAYRRNPANVLWAVEYGEMLGLSTMAAMTGVHVIEGKPSASAGLISGLVRQAGHRLRVWGDNKSATCEITRSDDPEHPFTVTWTLRKEPGDNPSAEVAGLLGKSVWKQYPASMLKSRAITQCARDACEEVLFGLHYTPEELGAEVDEDGVVVGEIVDERQGSQDLPPDQTWHVHPVPETEAAEEWIAASLRIIPHLGMEACRKLWREAREKLRDGAVTEAGCARVLDPLKARMEALAAPPQDADATPPAEAEAASPVAAGLDPDDPWTAKVEECSDEEDAEAALVEALGQLSDGEIDAARYGQIEDGLVVKFPRLRRMAEEPAA